MTFQKALNQNLGPGKRKGAKIMGHLNDLIDMIRFRMNLLFAMYF